MVIIFQLFVSIFSENKMPRHGRNRFTLALNHPNPIVGCIMALQENIKIISRSIIGCQCPQHESTISSLQEKITFVENELSSLRNELSTLENKFKSLSSHNNRLRTFIKDSGDQYRQRIQTLCNNNSSRFILHTCQDNAYRAEIISLRSEVNQLQGVLSEHEISLPVNTSSPAWILNVNSRPHTWILNPKWAELNPGVFPPISPNDNDCKFSAGLEHVKKTIGLKIVNSSLTPR
jgi:hypothetical protein